MTIKEVIMSTGYTNEIKEGVSFEAFALICARNFGACITMRDESHDTPIPKEFKVSDYYAKAKKEAKQKLAVIKKMTDAEITKKIATDVRAQRAVLKQRLKDNNNRKRLYIEMRNKARAWTPPTSDHNGLKKFMIEQITSSIDFDDMQKYYKEDLEKLKIVSVDEWVASKTLKYQQDIAYHEKHHAEEVERVNGRNKWVRELRDSLKK